MSTQPLIDPMEELKRRLAGIPRPPANPAGLTSPGNINIYDRPVVPNPAEGKGQSSTVWSGSFGNDRGEVLVPRVTDGEDGRAPHLLSDRRANRQPSEMEQYYQKYGKSLGTFDTPEHATQYAQGLHEQQAGLVPYGGRTTLPTLITPQMKQALQTQAALTPLPVPANVPVNMSQSLRPLPMPQAPAVPRLDPAIQNTTDRLLTAQGEMRRLQTTGDGISQIKNPFLHGLARTGDVLESIIAPHAEAVTPGTSGHHLQLLGTQQGQIDDALKNQQEQAQTANIGSQMDERSALARKADSLADATAPMMITHELASAVGSPQLEGISMTSRDYQRLLANHQTVQGHITTNANTNDTRHSISDDKIDAAAQQGQAARESRESIAEAANKTRRLIAGEHDATSRSNNANTNSHKAGGGTTAAGGSFKVPAEVTKRAALGSNTIENANAVDELLKQRPEIVGSVGGRYTSVQQMIGSDDPAIAELGVRMHNIALASNGAHGVRAQQAIGQTEQELFNHFKSGPHAIHSALDATRSSMQTFLNDEKGFQDSGRRNGGQSGGVSAFTDNGVTYHIPADQVAEFKKDHPNAR